MTSVCRPEHKAPPDIFYNDDEAQKYTGNSRIQRVQYGMAKRAIELMALPDGVSCHLLDLGCGSGLAGECLEEDGHQWVGMDISHSMLKVANNRGVQGDLIFGDIGHGLPFRAGTFDGAISISALQWLCIADKTCHYPIKRILKLFTSVYACLRRGARAVFQFYPENDKQLETIAFQAMRAGFTGGYVVDYPNSTKAKKYFLVLMSGVTQQLPKGLSTEGALKPGNIQVFCDHRRERIRKPIVKPLKRLGTRRNWVMKKKKRRRRQGKETRPDTKFTGRKRSGQVNL